MLVRAERRVRLGSNRDHGDRQVADAFGTPLVGTDVERHAIAELPGIGDLVGAVGAGVTDVLVLEQRLERVIARCARHVGERLGVAESKARPLDEGAGRIHRDRILVRVVDVHRHVGAQRAVGGLCAAVEVEMRAMLRRIRVHRAILRATRSSIVRLPTAGGVPAIVGADVTANLETDLTSGDVIEALAVETTDFHIFDRPGLHRQVGCLRAGDRGQRSSGAEKHTLRHCHVSPPKYIPAGGQDGHRKFSRFPDSEFSGGARRYAGHCAFPTAALCQSVPGRTNELACSSRTLCGCCCSSVTGKR
jgi:hypothetical protein